MSHSSRRKVPVTMATQHPDNARPPYWHHKAFISTSKEVEECFRSFSELGCHEYMWDWEGKYVDEAVVDRLYERYFNYFKKLPLGKENYLTFRVPNISKEGPARLVRAFTGILSAAYSAHELKFKHPPLFEVIHPMTTSAQQLKTLQKSFYETAHFYQKIFGIKNLKPQTIDIIPLIEGTGTLLKSRKILENYADFLTSFTKKKPSMLRPFIARSDPALDGGFVAAVLSAKAALSEYFRFAQERKIKVYPIMGVGSLRFRGGLSPDTIEEFISTYPGVATVTVQSSFRYDHDLKKVKSAIAKLNKSLPDPNFRILSQAEMQSIRRLDKILVKHYQQTIVGLANFINHLSQYIPSRRERLQHTGHFGYSRQIGKKGLELPRAIAFTAVFYSLGIPPELIGLGRGLQEAHQAKLIDKLLAIYPELPKVLLSVGRYFNQENLDILTRYHGPFRAVQKGIKFLEDFLGASFGPQNSDQFLHRNYTSNVVQNWTKKRELEEDILKAALIRRSLG